MSTKFWATRKIIEGSMIVDMKGYEFDNHQVIEAIKRLKKIYNQQGGEWKLLCWVENNQGRVLHDFEMEAERIGGRGERVLFSMVRMEDPVRRYR